MKRHTIGSAVGAVALAATTTVGAASASAAPEPEISKYVSLGDSYVAGPLIPWNSSWCFRSNNNYPSWLATHLGVYDAKNGFVDASCSSADTTNFTQPQAVPSPSFQLDTHQPQLEAVTPDTDLVTIGIGGNDYGLFGTVAYDCPEYRDDDPTGSPCRDHFTKNGVDTLKAVLPKTQRNITNVVRKVRDAAPAARIVLVGYPRLVPPSGYCPKVIPLADGDYAWADDLNRGLNRAVAKAATATGATYVDTYGPALGHDACAGDAAWIQGQQTDLFGAYAMHPNGAGMRAIGDLVYKKLTGTNPPKTLRAPAVDPADRGDTKRQREVVRDRPEVLIPSRR